MTRTVAGNLQRFRKSLSREKKKSPTSDPAIAEPFMGIEYLKDHALWLLEHDYIPSDVSEILCHHSLELYG
jgi:hypothetical protein